MDDIVVQCETRWPGLLLALGVDQKYLTGRHGPCPFCGGRDRYRFDDKGRGMFFCGQCGSGDGFTFLRRMFGWDFNEAANRLRPLVGSIRPSITREARDRGQLEKLRAGLWNAGWPLKSGDPVVHYLSSRAIDRVPEDVRYVERCLYETRVWYPAMVAKVTAPSGRMATLHRTYLDPTKNAKIDAREPRKLMPGHIDKGSAVRLSPSGATLGVAEGIETALSASILYDVPVWSTINAGGLMAFSPPLEVSELIIFGDNDPKFGGQSSAYALAHRISVLATAPRKVRVMIPEKPGQDWNDVLMDRRRG